MQPVARWNYPPRLAYWNGFNSRQEIELLNNSIYQRRVLLLIAVAFFDKQVHLESSCRETIWLRKANPEKVIILRLDDLLVFIGAQHVRRMARG